VLRSAAHGAIRAYQLTLSGLVGRQCRHWPSCSTYTDEAIAQHGLWAGGWIGFSRICRCGPLGTHGIDLVPDALPTHARWFLPWRYGRWRGVNAPPSPFACDGFEAGEPSLSPRRSTASPPGSPSP
jgi:putative membrane protein insertion efficiency factor